MNQNFDVNEGVWWLTLEGSPHPCTARADIRGKEIVIFDFWTHGPLQGKGLAKKLLTQIRGKFRRVSVRAIESKKAERFWKHMLKLELIDEIRE